VRSIPTLLNNELLKDASYLATLVEMYLSSTVYYTNLDVPLVYGGHTYLSRGFTFSGAEYSMTPMIDKITLDIDNVEREFSAFVLGQETRGKRCIIKLAAMEGKDNLILNGGFEIPGEGGADVFSDWEEACTGSSTITQTISVLAQSGVPLIGQSGIPIVSQSGGSEKAYRGHFCCNFYHDAAENYAMVSQNLTLTPHRRYRLKLYYQTDAGIYANLLLTRPEYTDIELKEDGTWGELVNGITLEPATIPTLVQIDFDGHMDYTEYHLALRTEGALSAGGHIWWDEVSLTPLDAPPAKISAVGIIFSGVLDSARITHQRASFDVYNPLIFWKRKTPRRIHQSSCPWPFAIDGSPCQYAGAETWCDQSFERCLELGNTDNFGGFRFLPDLQDKQIWWGKKAS